MSPKHLKEAFVSNLNGTSITEISLGLTVVSFCALFRGLLLVHFNHKLARLVKSWKVSFFIDFILLVLPLVATCTILSDYLLIIVGCLAGLCVLLLNFINQRRFQSKKSPLLKVWQNFLNAQVKSGVVPAVTALRVFLNILTAVSILGVDFPIFPRRYAKTETYGTGVMDVGVGCFIFGNALVSPESRSSAKHAQSFHVKKQIQSVWPLVLLGIARLISVKALDYHEHVSEYGVHWNFFFTLAIVRVLSSLICTFISPKHSWLMAAIIISGYQVFLEVTNLRIFILYGSDGQGTRDGFLHANREGLFSIFGFVAIYMTGVQVGHHVLKNRMFVKEWIILIFRLMIIASLLSLGTALLQIYVEPVSRRIANISFCTWIAGQCVAWLCLILICDLILLLAKYITPGISVPSTWDLLSSKDSLIRKVTNMNQKNLHCLIGAINRNQLLFFLLSNIMTGIVNMSVDTIHSSISFSFIVLVIYMLINCFTVYILHIYNITVKFW